MSKQSGRTTQGEGRGADALLRCAELNVDDIMDKTMIDARAAFGDF
jgi:hypothetical protein